MNNTICPMCGRTTLEKINENESVCQKCPAKRLVDGEHEDAIIFNMVYTSDEILHAQKKELKNMKKYTDLADYDLEIIDCYERDYYVFSNFSSFSMDYEGTYFPTSEHLYHYFKFTDPVLQQQIREAKSAHEAFKLAEVNKHLRRTDWDDIKLDVMEKILRMKVEQHPYVKKKLIASGNQPIIECSWRDDYWGWGPNKDGQNQLGRLWMKIRKDYVE